MGSWGAWDPGRVLLRKDTLERIAAGEVDVAFRWWTRPTVKAGGTLQTPIGQLAISSVAPVAVSAVTVEDVRRAGFPTKAALLRAFPRKPGSRLYRVEFGLAGPDPRLPREPSKAARPLLHCGLPAGVAQSVRAAES